MVAESLVRILNKLRSSALNLGTFHVPVLGRMSTPVKEDAHLPAHDAVLAPLFAKAVECRVYGVSRKSKLFVLLERIGQRHGRVWHLDLSQELIRGYEPLWNAADCEHMGIAIVSQLSLEETQTIFDSCGCPDAWASRNQLSDGTSRTAVSFCFEVASGNRIAFLIPGSNGLEWIDVFADKEHLPILWDQAMRKRLG